MANQFKGEVAFNAGGKDYKLSYSANAMCELEDALDKGLNEIIAQVQDVAKLRLGTMRSIFWAGMLDHQPDTTPEDVKTILKHMSPKTMSDLITDAFKKAMPGGEGDENPPKPGQENGTGPGSSAPGAA